MPIIGGGGGGGGSGGGAVLFDSTLLVDAPSIDTGANGIAGGYRVLEIFITHRTDDAGATGTCEVTFNNDSSGVYGRQFIDDANTTLTGVIVLGTGTNQPLLSHGSGGSASHAATSHIIIPNYDGTTFFKTGEIITARPDTSGAGFNSLDIYSHWYRSTAAITRAKAAALAANLKAGSRMTILGF